MSPRARISPRSTHVDFPVKSTNVDMIVRTPRDLGALIRDRRRRQGLDQRTLAERVGVSRQWLIEVEKGKSGAELGLILRTLDALGVALSVDGPTRGGRAIAPVPAPDIDAIVERARKAPPAKAPPRR